MIKGSMKIFTVHLNTKHHVSIEKAMFIKEGFSLYGFFLHFFWLFYYRIWIEGAIVFCIFMLFGMLEAKGLVPVVHTAILQLGLQAYIGFAGPDWLRRALERRGYSFVGVVSGKDEVDAQQRFFDRYTQSHRYPVPVSEAVV